MITHQPGGASKERAPCSPLPKLESHHVHSALEMALPGDHRAEGYEQQDSQHQSSLPHPSATCQQRYRGLFSWLK